MANEEGFHERVEKAMSEGIPFPDFPEASPLESLAYAYSEATEAFEKAGFKRGEAVYLTSAMFCGSPSIGPINQSG